MIDNQEILRQAGRVQAEFVRATKQAIKYAGISPDISSKYKKTAEDLRIKLEELMNKIRGENEKINTIGDFNISGFRVLS